MSKKETLEEVVKVKRTELFNTILSIVKQIPRKDIDYDAMDAPSCAYEIEQLFYKWQQEQGKNKYSDEDLRTAYFSGIKTTGEGWNGEYANGNSPNVEETFEEGFQEWLKQFKNK
jgi:hypothetical protein